MDVNCARSICLGRVTDAFFDRVTFSNLSELIFDSKLYALLRLCGADEAEIGERASDYDRFKAYCKALPMLSGHPIVSKISTILKSCFGIDKECSSKTCDEIWQAVSQKLFDAPMSGWDCIKANACGITPQVLLCKDNLAKMDRIPTGIVPVLCGNTLIETIATDWGTWEREISQAIDLCVQKGSRAVYFKISDDLANDIPSLYHVEQALRSDHCAFTGLLLTQALRQLCLICNKEKMTLYLDIDARDAEKIAVLLEHIYKSVGLPGTVFFSRDIFTLEVMIALSERLPIGLMRAGFMTSHYPSAHEMEMAYEAAVARYPAGMLHVLYGDDLRYSAYEKNRFEKL